MTVVAPRVREAMREHPGFEDIGKRMLFAWHEGLMGLADKRVYALGALALADALAGLSDSQPAKSTRTVIGRSPLLGK